MEEKSLRNTGLGFGKGLEKEKQLRFETSLSPIFFSGYSYSHTVACCGHLTLNQKLLICTTHKKNKRQTVFLYSEKQN